MPDRPTGDVVDQQLRGVMSELAELAAPAPDLEELQSPILSLSEGDEAMGNRTRWMIAAAAAVVIGIAGIAVALASGADTDDTIVASSPAQTLIGTWEISTKALAGGLASAMQVNEDSSYWFWGRAGTDTIIERGHYEIEGDLVTLIDDDNADCGGAVGEYRMTFDGTDRFNFETIEDECTIRAAELGGSQLVRTSG